MMKDIAGYEGVFAVTSCGKVWSHKSKRFLKQHADKDGYMRVNLYFNGKFKNYFVHRLVLEAYNPTTDMTKTQVNHKSEKKNENWLSNLGWMTPKENSNYGTRNERMAQPRKKRVRCIETDTVYESLSEAANATGTKVINISRVCRNVPSYFTAGGFHWEYSV